MSVYEALYDAVQDGVTPGAAAVVVTGDGHHRLAVTTGRLGWEDETDAVSETTRYDLASLTKLLCTTVLAAIAVDAGKLDLDEAPWPAWPGVTVRHALRHDGGLQPWGPFFEDAIAHRVVGLPAGRRAVLDAVLASEPAAAPGETTRYSDVGFIALGALLEERLGDRLDRLFDSCAHAFGEHGLTYVPIFERGYLTPVRAVAPTEHCPWRGRALQGQVHDDNCFAMGGIAGHAGLFGGLLDTECAARYLLDAVRGADPSALGRTLKAWAEEPHARGLGFDRADPDGTTGGVLSERAVGHLGFTGTSLWVDPAMGGSGAAFVLLTNRVHPSRDREGIADLRRAFHRAAAAWLRSEQS
jgi:CubicO group peptidase (beta-lactamase class C family)